MPNTTLVEQLNGEERAQVIRTWVDSLNAAELEDLAEYAQNRSRTVRSANPGRRDEGRPLNRVERVFHLSPKE